MNGLPGIISAHGASVVMATKRTSHQEQIEHHKDAHV